MNYVQLFQAIQDYAENTESLFVANISRFVQEAEERIYNTVQIPSLRRNVTGTATNSNPYLSCPDDYLSSFSLAVIKANGEYEYLLNKDVNFIRQAYPSPNDVGVPKYYALFGSQYTNPRELSFILGPTPNDDYNVELHYFYYPESIVQGSIVSLNEPIPGAFYTNGVYPNVPLTGGQGVNATATVTIAGNQVVNVLIDNNGYFYGVDDVLTTNSAFIGGTGNGFEVSVRLISNPTGTSWLGDNYDPVLFYGAMREAMLFMKSEPDLVKYYDDRYQEALAQLNRLGTGLERGDSYRDGQAKIRVNP